RRGGWIRARAEVRVARQVVRTIREVEHFDEPFDADPSRNTEGSAQARVHREEIAAHSRIARNELAVHDCTRRGPLNRRRAACDVEWVGRLGLLPLALLKVEGHGLARTPRRISRRIPTARELEPMPLIVIRAAPVFR